MWKDTLVSSFLIFSITLVDAERKVADEIMANEKKAKSAVPVNATSRPTRSRVQLKDPLDMSNARYLEVLKSRQMTAGTIDYINDNIVSTSVLMANSLNIDNFVV